MNEDLTLCSPGHLVLLAAERGPQVPPPDFAQPGDFAGVDVVGPVDDSKIRRLRFYQAAANGIKVLVLNATAREEFAGAFKQARREAQAVFVEEHTAVPPPL
jgi:hypothetical protein